MAARNREHGPEENSAADAPDLRRAEPGRSGPAFREEGWTARNAAGESVLALINDAGVVAAWTRGAEQLIGLPTGEAVGRRAEFFLGPDDGLTISGLADRIAGRHGWSDDVQTAYADRCHLRISRLTHAAGDVFWLLSAPATAAAGIPARRVSAGSRPHGVAVWDQFLRCIMVNDELEQADGIPRAQLLGHRMAQMIPGIDAEALETVMRNVLRNGTPITDYRHRQHRETSRSRDRTHLVSLFRLDGADGVGMGVCSLLADVTDEQRENERLAVLGRASIRVGTTDDIMRTAQELADFTVPSIGDYVTVDLAESVRLGEEPLALLGPDAGRIPVFHRAGVASIHPDLREALFGRGHPVFVPPSSPFTEVLATGSSHFQPALDASRDEWFQRDPDRARVVKATGMHTLMIIPVREGDAILGITVFVRTENPQPFDEEDLRLAEELVGQTARRLNQQRANAHDRAMALALQHNLLPRHLEGGPGLEVASRFVPADVEEGVGGDWFDVIALGGSRTGLVVGDVVGHGIGAAAAMGRLRTAVRTLAYMDLPPHELLTRMDHVLMSFAEGDAMDEAAMSAITGATCLYVVYDRDTQRVTLASAGHPPPAIVSPNGAVSFAEVPAGTPLGYGLSRYEQVELDVVEGSVIALYTDGLVETRGSDIEMGMKRLAKALAHPEFPLEELCEAAYDARPSDQFAARHSELQLREPADDATLLLARVGVRDPGDDAR